MSADQKASPVEVKLGFNWQGLLISVVVGVGIVLIRLRKG